MRKPWIAVQLPAAPHHLSTHGPDSTARSISLARELAGADALILQPEPDLGRTALLAQAARRAGMEVFLWLPVFADLPSPAPLPGTLTRNADGSTGHGRSGAWEGLGRGEETFLFRCPGDERNVAAARAALEALLDTLDVDGVMLDKVRFPSPSNGLEALFCCFCESCRAAFDRAADRPLDEVRRACAAFLGLLRSHGAAALEDGWTDPGSLWRAARIEDLAAFRAKAVAAAVAGLAGVVKGRGLRVGLDLFSPSLAPLVGQDYAALAGLCDWMKPMTYRAAAGPAGLPLEIASLWRGLQALGPGKDPQSVRRTLDRLFPWGLPSSPEALLERGLPADVISSELSSLSRGRRSRSAAIMAGIEAVQLPQFGIHVTPGDLEASLRAARSRADGVVVSWDLRHVPQENLEVIGTVMR